MFKSLETREHVNDNLCGKALSNVFDDLEDNLQTFDPFDSHSY